MSSKISLRKDVRFFFSYTLHLFPYLFHVDCMSCYSRGFVVWNFTWKSHGYIHQFHLSWVFTSILLGSHEMLFMWICCLKFHVEKTWPFWPVLTFMGFHIYSMWITRDAIHMDLLSKISSWKDVYFFPSFTLHVFPQLFHVYYTRCYSREFVV